MLLVYDRGPSFDGPEQRDSRYGEAFHFWLYGVVRLTIYVGEGWIPLSDSSFVAWTCAGYCYGIYSSLRWIFGTEAGKDR